MRRRPQQLVGAERVDAWYGWSSGDGCSATAIAPPRRPAPAPEAGEQREREDGAAAHQKDAPRGGAESWSATTEVAASTAQ